MTIRNTSINIQNINQGGSSFYPSRFASFCEMGNISDLVFNNRLSDQNNNENKKIKNQLNSNSSTNDHSKNALTNNAFEANKNNDIQESQISKDPIKHVRVT